MKKSVKIILAVVVSLCVVYSALVMSGAFVKKEPETTKPVQCSSTDLKFDKNVELRIISCFDAKLNDCTVKVYAKKITDDDSIKFLPVTDDKKMGDYTLVSENQLSKILDMKSSNGVTTADQIYSNSNGQVSCIVLASSDFVSSGYENNDFKSHGEFKKDIVKVKDEHGKEYALNVFTATLPNSVYNGKSFVFFFLDKDNNKKYGM